LLPVIIAMVYEVVARKLFVAPTDWAYDTSRMISGAMFMLGAGYALMRGVHIRADFLYRNWKPSTQALVDAALYLLFYFPAMLFFFWIAAEYSIKTWVRWELTMDSALMAPLAPMRAAMPIGILLLFLQGVAELLRAYHDLSPKLKKWFRKLSPIYVISLATVFINVFFPEYLQFQGLTDLSLKGVGGFEPKIIGLFMIAVMLLAIFVGFPISFTLIFLGFVFGAWGFGTKLVFHLQTLQFNNVMLEQTLAAVPLFVFMGILMEQAGLMERLFTSVQLMLSRTRGALYLAVLFVSTIFAAATGIVGASVTILGIMAAKTMNRSGYDVRLAAGTITAGGTLGILIPPSIMLVVMGPVLEVPVTDLFSAAIIPGIMLAAMYAGYALIRCWMNPALGPILTPEDQPVTSSYYWLEAVLVIGSISDFLHLIVMGFSGSLQGIFPFSSLLLPLGWMGVMYVAAVVGEKTQTRWVLLFRSLV
jgi:TRAP-type mannitol/chloroaromatic compound transport system permease small subunit